MFGSRSYGPAVDLWSAGALFAEMLAGRPLFPGTSDIDQLCRTFALLGSIDEAAWPGEGPRGPACCRAGRARRCGEVPPAS